MDLPKRISSGWQGRRRKDIPCQSVIVKCTCLSLHKKLRQKDCLNPKVPSYVKTANTEKRNEKTANPIARINKCPKKLKILN